MLRLIRYILNGNALEVLAILVVVLLVWWVFSLITAPNTGPTPPEPADPSGSPGYAKVALGLLAAALVLWGLFAISNSDGPPAPEGGLLHVVAMGPQPDRDIVLRVDDQPVAPVLLVDHHLAFPVPSGRHAVFLKDSAVDSSRDFEVDIREGDAFMLSVHPDLCPVQIDMSALTYGQPSRSTRTPLDGVVIRTLPVVGVFTRTELPMRLPPGAVLSFNELPDALSPGLSASILIPLPCSMAQDDRTLWAEVRKRFPGLDDAARRVGYTEADPTRREVAAMDEERVFELFKQQGAALARETPP
ncbi:hypothetical protein COCOR_02972 [Corallococcus coralloides DSM 2259]|uniref:Uncharacterized protein n=1 Tax=Corallococcus coralloides (strain ATCC 25202 / DSM 2259 / NBRC 100086 / M2) TaxID=1144275 RepID=H8N093_CORCM|nr:hypothetical protein [Corallococcus coralloides]AFE04951.1 hypothetical protein COCOR_02972 [Corallococcus coralloides DSM 2259]